MRQDDPKGWWFSPSSSSGQAWGPQSWAAGGVENVQYNSLLSGHTSDVGLEVVPDPRPSAQVLLDSKSIE